MSFGFQLLELRRRWCFFLLGGGVLLSRDDGRTEAVSNLNVDWVFAYGKMRDPNTDFSNFLQRPPKRYL